MTLTEKLMVTPRGHELLPTEIQKVLPAYYSTEEIPRGEKVVHLRLFTPTTGWTWYILEYDPENKLFFALVDGFELEFGPVSLEELESMNAAIERDLYWKPKKLSEIEEIRKRLPE